MEGRDFVQEGYPLAHNFQFLVRIDWATARRQVCLLDKSRDLAAKRVVELTGPELAHLVCGSRKSRSDRT